MNRAELIEALLIERWATPIREDRPLHVPVIVVGPQARATDVDIAALVAELYPLRLVETCAYAACDEPADETLDGWAFCRSHARLHRDEVAS